MSKFAILLKIIYFTKEEQEKILAFLIDYMGFRKKDTYKDFDEPVGAILIYTVEKTLEYHLRLEEVKKAIDNKEIFYSVEKAINYVKTL